MFQSFFAAGGGVFDFLDSLQGMQDTGRSPASFYGSLQFIIWPVILGVILSFFIAYYRRRVIGAFIRSVRSAGAVDEESAKSLAELGQENNASAVSALKRSAVLRRIVRICGEGETINADTRVYIPEEMETAARAQFGDEAEPIYPLILGSVALIALGILILVVMQ